MGYGQLIVGVGLPGSGKTSLFREVACLVGGKVWLEPEEKIWDKAVSKRDEYGHIGGLHWFRSQRVPNLIDARASADNGNLTFLDTFYDKICFSYLGKPGMEWLISPSDPYFMNFLQTAELDRLNLPDADVVVSIKVDEADWLKMVGARQRQLDNMVRLTRTYHTQDLFISAAKEYCSDRGVKLIEFKNIFSTVQESAVSLHELLISNGIKI